MNGMKVTNAQVEVSTAAHGQETTTTATTTATATTAGMCANVIGASADFPFRFLL